MPFPTEISATTALVTSEMIETVPPQELLTKTLFPMESEATPHGPHFTFTFAITWLVASEMTDTVLLP